MPGKIRKNTLARRRWNNFRRNRRGFYSLIFFSVLLATSLCAEVLSNDKPFLIKYEGSYYFPLLKTYPETVFGGDFDSETDYRDNANGGGVITVVERVRQFDPEIQSAQHQHKAQHFRHSQQPAQSAGPKTRLS